MDRTLNICIEAAGIYIGVKDIGIRLCDFVRTWKSPHLESYVIVQRSLEFCWECY